MRSLSSNASISTLKDFMLQCFKKMCPKKVIIDCTKLFTSSSCRCQSPIFSNYKHRNTSKASAGIAISGEVTFVSYVFVKNSIKKHITKHCDIRSARG